MRKTKRIGIISVCVAMLSLLSAFTGVKGVEAAEIPKYHDIPAYQVKNLWETERVKITGLQVKEVVNATVHPVITKDVEKDMEFVIFNSTLQKVEERVTLQNGKFPELNLIKDHNYTIMANDSEYRMNNVYVWVNGGALKNIKDITPLDDQWSNVEYTYSEVKELHVYKRDKAVQNPQEEDQRVQANLDVLLESGGWLFNVGFKLVSDVETIEITNGNKQKLQPRLLEDVNYMVTVDHKNFDVLSYPIVVKDKSEYGGGRYTYDHSDCNAVDKVQLVNKGEGHKYDQTITSVSGSTTVSGFEFNDICLLEKILDMKVPVLEGKDYEVIDIKTMNPHRGEVCELAAGEFEVTEKITQNKQVSEVYYLKNDKLQNIDFTQSGNTVSFTMNSMGLYPVVFVYNGEEAEFDNTVLNLKVEDESGKPVEGLELYMQSENYEGFGDLEVSGTTDKSGKLSYECSGNEFDDDVYKLQPIEGSEYTCENPLEIVFGKDDDWNIFIASVNGEEYNSEVTLTVKKIGEEPEQPFDNTVLDIKVEDELGKPVEGLKLYMQSENYEGFGDLEVPGTTDESGKLSYECSGNEFDDDVYKLQPIEESDYTCENPLEVVFGKDDDWNIFVDTVNGAEYKGEVVLTVKAGKEEPEQPDGPSEETKKALEDAITEAKLLDAESYTEESWQIYDGAVKAAEEILVKADATEEDFQKALDAIREAKDSLQKEDVEEPEQKNTVLKVKVVDEKNQPIEGLALYMKSVNYEGIGDLEVGGVTDASGKLSYECTGNEFDDDVYRLQPVEESDYTCEKPLEVIFGVDENWNTFIESVDGVTYKEEVTLVVNGSGGEEPEPEINKEDLVAAIEKAEAVENKNYTDDSWNALQNAIKAAKVVLEDKDATQTQIDDQVKALEDAIKALKAKPEPEKPEPEKPEPEKPDPEKPGTSDPKPNPDKQDSNKPDGSSGNAGGNNKPADGNVTPKTGDTAQPFVYMVGMLAAVGVCAIVFRRKRVK